MKLFYALASKVVSMTVVDNHIAPTSSKDEPDAEVAAEPLAKLPSAAEPLSSGKDAEVKDVQGNPASSAEHAARGVSFCVDEEVICHDAGSGIDKKPTGDADPDADICQDAPDEDTDDEDPSDGDSASCGSSDSDDRVDDGAALAAGLAEMPKGLLQNLISGGKLGNKPLHHAAAKNDVDSLQKLLAQEFQGSVDDLDPFNYTALHVAVESGSEEAVAFLLKEGADVEKQTKMHMSRPIHYACFEGHSEICQVLLNAGCDVDARTDDLRTPLYQASFRGHAACVKVLLDAGADRTVATKEGKLALDVCENDTVRDLLEQPVLKKARKNIDGSVDD